MPIDPRGIHLLVVVLFLEGVSPFPLDRINDANHRLTLNPRSSSTPTATTSFSSSSSTSSRSEFVETVVAISAGLLTATTTAGNVNPSLAFEGGVGGLGKTKPETGVTFLEGSEPIQNAAGIVSAELLLLPSSSGGSQRSGRPVRVEFTAPWPLLSGSAGLEARDLQTSESAFVQVVTDSGMTSIPASSSAAKDLFLQTVFSSQGKFAAYGSPMDVKVRKVGNSDGAKQDPNAPSMFAVSFTTFTPGLRESERQAIISCRQVGTSLVMLVVGTTAQRFKAQQPLIEKVASSLQAFETPELARR